MNSQAPPIRMVFELAREEHPRLYDDLIRFPKGTKRINRLRTLAHDGLLLGQSVALQIPHRENSMQDIDSSARQLTNQIFETPLAE